MGDVAVGVVVIDPCVWFGSLDLSEEEAADASGSLVGAAEVFAPGVGFHGFGLAVLVDGYEVPAVVEIALVGAVVDPAGDAAALVVVGVLGDDGAAFLDGYEAVFGVPDIRSTSLVGLISVEVEGGASG